MGEFVSVGKFNKSFGDKGILRFTIFEDYKTDFSKAAFLFVVIDGTYVPFPIASRKSISENEIKLQFVDTQEEAEELSSKAIYLESSDISIKTEAISTLTWGFLKGYQAYDQQEAFIGIITEVQSFPMQEMAIIDDQPEFLIPIHPNLISNVDKQAKKVFFELPEGLISDYR